MKTVSDLPGLLWCVMLKDRWVRMGDWEQAAGAPRQAAGHVSTNNTMVWKDWGGFSYSHDIWGCHLRHNRLSSISYVAAGRHLCHRVVFVLKDKEKKTCQQNSSQGVSGYSRQDRAHLRGSRLVWLKQLHKCIPCMFPSIQRTARVRQGGTPWTVSRTCSC